MILSIHIPTGAHVKVKSGDNVDLNTPLFETTSSAEYIQSFAGKLGVEPSKIFRYLKKFVGEDIHKGDVIAIKKGLLSTNKIISEYDGKIKEIDHIEGKIIITTKGKKNTANSFIKGEITEIKNKEIFIKVKESKEFDLKNASSDFGGKTLYLKDTIMSFSSSDVTKKIVVNESVSSYVQSKLEALEITGYVTLMKLTDITNLPSAQLKTVQEFSEIMKHMYPYCYVESKSGKITFYR